MKNDPLQQLVEEHRYIMIVIKFLETLPTEIASGRSLDTGLLRQIITFMREFADHCHHAKEEDQLFPALIAAGVPDSGCPIGGLKAEHAKGRHLVDSLEKAVALYATEEEQARVALQKAIAGIVKLYPDHIWKEEEMVFPIAERAFGDEQLATLQNGFNRVEFDHHDSHHRHMAFALGLEKRLETPRISHT